MRYQAAFLLAQRSHFGPTDVHVHQLHVISHTSSPLYSNCTSAGQQLDVERNEGDHLLASCPCWFGPLAMVMAPAEDACIMKQL